MFKLEKLIIIIGWFQDGSYKLKLNFQSKKIGHVIYELHSGMNEQICD